jgi:hypothetical protein
MIIGIAAAGAAYAGSARSGFKKGDNSGTSHWMFEQAPQRFCEIVLEFLAA